MHGLKVAKRTLSALALTALTTLPSQAQVSPGHAAVAQWQSEFQNRPSLPAIPPAMPPVLPGCGQRDALIATYEQEIATSKRQAAMLQAKR